MRILLVEDVAADARLVRETLSGVRGALFEVESRTTLADGMRRASEAPFDVILLDLGLPDSRGVETLRRAVEASPSVAIVVLTGLDDEELAAEALQHGAQDYLDKGRLDPEILARTLRHAIERKKAEAALLRENALLRVMQETATTANESPTPEHAYEAGLRAICELTGWHVGHVYEAVEHQDALAGPDLVSLDVWHYADEASGPERLRHATASRSRVPCGADLPGRVVRDGRPIWLRDLSQEPDFPRAEAAIESGFRSAFAFPVMAGHEIVAVLEFFSPRVEPPDERLLEVAAHVGKQLGRAVERQRAEAVLRASEAEFRALAETAQESIVTADSSRRIVYVNPATERTFGRSHANLMGRPIDALFSQNGTDDLPRALADAPGGPSGRSGDRTLELRGMRSDGAEFPVELSFADWDRAGERFLTLIIRDITGRKAAEAALNELNQELERRVEKRTADLAAANTELESFSYSVSHDLRAPLRAIDGFSRILLDTQEARLDERGKSLLGKVRNASQRMGRLIDDLLELSRVGRTPMQTDEIDLTAVAREVVGELRTTSASRDVEVRIEDDLRATGDPTLLRCVLENLLSNAWKFTSKHERAVIEFGSMRERDETVYYVRDDGAGFEPAYKDKLFRPFQRLHTEAEFEGTGIGLATVQRIVRRHGGRAWAHGSPERGATFCFTLSSGGPPHDDT